MRTFKKYVAPQIVQEILDSGNPEALMVGGRVVNIAVLFVDIRGFTTMSEKLTPSEVVEILNQYLDSDRGLYYAKRRHTGQIHRRCSHGILGELRFRRKTM